MEKVYNPHDFEDRLYKDWEEHGYFRAEIDENKVPFTIMMPPPNITGQLHMGHALDNTLQDAITRFKRMQGYCALWLPGTDHASIATEVKIVEQMAKEGLTKQDVGREGFLKRAWAWKEKYGGRIIEQLKKNGFVLRLVAPFFHHGRKMLQGGQGGVRQPLQQGAHLPWFAHNQLVPLL